MKMTLWILTVMLVVGLFCDISQAQDRGKVRCEASAFHMGGEGQVTCHYPVDLNQRDHAVSIEQFVGESENHVLECVWDRIRNCRDVRQGYRISNFTGNTLTVTIPKVTDEHMGRYRCTLADRMDTYDYDLCTFEVKDRTKTRCEASAVHIGGEGQITCHYPMDLSQLHCVVGIERFVDKSDTHIMSCLWEDIIQHDCSDIRQGYRITNFTGNTLNVTIPKVTDEHVARYRCSLIDEEKVHDCELCDFVANRAIPPSHQLESSMRGEANDQPEAITPSHQSESSTKGDANDQPGSDNEMSGGGIAGIALAVLLPTATLAMAVLVCRYRRCPCQKRNNPAAARFIKSANSQENEVCTLNLDNPLEGTNAVTGEKGTKYKDTISSLESGDSGFADTKTENGDTIGSREGNDQNSPQNHSTAVLLDREGDQSVENREMAENTERQDAASDVEGTADNTAPLLSDQESRLVQDAEEREKKKKWLLASPGY